MNSASGAHTRLLVSALAVASFATPSAAAAPQQPVARNIRLARVAPLPWAGPPGPGRSFLVSEQTQGGNDLNGDGDALDRVLHVLPQFAGPVLSVGLASDLQGPLLAGDTVAMGVSEADQGGVDLNGDGDGLDSVLHLVDANSGIVTNTGLALFDNMLRLSEDFVAFAVYENAQGITDLNGDGDALDRVLHVIELAGGTVTNLGLAVNSLALEGGAIAAYVDEHAQGQDLNGDGDTFDLVLHVVDAATGAAHNQGFAGSFGLSLSFGHVAYGLPESTAAMDLTGDGDQLDTVVQLVEASTGNRVNTGLATHEDTLNDGPFLVVVVSEPQQGADANLDGDKSDRVPYVLHLPSGSVTNTALAVSEVSGLHGRRLTLHVSEFSQGQTDLNGDGDFGDNVLHVVDVAAGTATNVGLQATRSYAGSRMVGLLVREAAQGGQDLNGDGDKSDYVWHVLDTSTGVVSNLGLATFETILPTIVGGDFVVCVAHEFSSGMQDFNGDGDLEDNVVFLLRAGMPAQNLGVSLTSSAIHKSLSSSGRRVIVPVFEASQGMQDLNGDGDFADNVVHVLDVP